jgi:hypothetical protein
MKTSSSNDSLGAPAPPDNPEKYYDVAPGDARGGEEEEQQESRRSRRSRRRRSSRSSRVYLKSKEAS